MKNYTEILAHYLSQKDAQVLFPDLKLDANAIVDNECLQIINKIQMILADDSLEDDACFEKIEEIVTTLEKAGINCGGRHDFG